MDTFPVASKIVKSLIAPARHSNGPTLYIICEADERGGCNIYEQTPEGECVLWPESPLPGRCQAEAAIYASVQVNQ